MAKKIVSKDPKAAYKEGLQRADSLFMAKTGGGLVNPVTGLGTSRDKLMYGHYTDGIRIIDPELTALYHNNDMAAKMVELKPKEMFRRGYDVVVGEEDKPKASGGADQASEGDLPGDEPGAPPPDGSNLKTDAFPEKQPQAKTSQDDPKALPEAKPKLDKPGAKDPSKAPPEPVTGLSLSQQVQEYGNNLKCNDTLRDGFIFGRLFGGSLTIIGADDGADMAEPLDETNIQSIRYLNNLDRRFIYADTYYSNPFEAKYGEVETYRITAPYGETESSIVHETRVLRFDGAPVDILKKRELSGWTMSVLQRPYDTLRQFDSSFQAAANLIVDSSQAVFKMNGLMEQIAAGESHTLQARMAMVDMSRSACRAVLLDQDNEDFERAPTSFTGLPDMLAMFMQRLAAAAEMPVSILFGKSPQGLNATGDADFQHFYDTIASEQKNYLEPLVKRLFTLICLAKDSPTKGKMPEKGIKISWHPLQQPNDVETADLFAKMSTADAAYINAGVLTPSEVALSRFRDGKLRMDTDIDQAAHKQIAAHDTGLAIQTAEAKAKAGPQLMQNKPPFGKPGEDPSGANQPVPANDGLTKKFPNA